MDADFLKVRIAESKELIAAYDAAIRALVSGGIQAYKLDTGQTNQTVTKFDLTALREARAEEYNNLCTLEARLKGACLQARPYF